MGTVEGEEGKPAEVVEVGEGKGAPVEGEEVGEDKPKVRSPVRSPLKY